MLFTNNSVPSTEFDSVEYLARFDEQLREKKALLETLQTERQKLSRRISALITMRAEEELSKVQFAEQYGPLEERAEQLDASMPELEAEIDFLTVQLYSTDTAIHETKALYDRWSEMPFAQQRLTVETITKRITLDKDVITITLAYAPINSLNAKDISRHHIPVRRFLPSRKIVKKPLIVKPPESPQTLGEHIRKKRIESGQLQKDVAEIVGVSEDTVTYWENNRATPQLHHYPKIIAYLGYYPFAHETETLAGKLTQIRHLRGLGFAGCARMLSVSVDAAKRWERGTPILNGKTRMVIEKIWNHLKNQHPL